MGFDAFAEPLLVFSILAAGVLYNRQPPKKLASRDGSWSPLSDSGHVPPQLEPLHRERKFFGRRIASRNTARWRNTFQSRVLARFPFLVEVWYWLLVYWTYQLGRAFTAVTLKANTVAISREHALQVIALEQRLHLFLEPAIQSWFLQHPTLLAVINCVYSFIHIPGTIAFLGLLFAAAPPALFAARRRTLALCNLMAFVVFTTWPCMPPRLLPESDGFGFVDTVHAGRVASVWTTNRFCNQLAAMPSLHFGYAFVIGATLVTLPGARLPLRVLGACYPALILVAIVATANHYILDAVAGLAVALLGWNANAVLLNLLWLEDWFFWVVRIHKPARGREEEAVDGAMSPGGAKGGSEEEWWRRA
ncbi:PAP2 superfamily-domain-containing protein [Geopyxis carbonaria]|nr:PAP2 superfamily-domain-containing protein [Geopyxis carbonaria]